MVSFVADSTFPPLPADGVLNYPHIVDIAGFDYLQEICEYEELGLFWPTLWDAVVTLLHTTAPAHLHDLLDLDREEVKVIVGDERREDKIVIWRKRGDVLVGGFMDHPEYGLYEWDNVVRCNISTVGAWKITHASFGLYTERDWSAVWNAGFTDALRHQQGAVYVNAMKRSHITLTLAQSIMEECPWSNDKFDWGSSS